MHLKPSTLSNVYTAYSLSGLLPAWGNGDPHITTLDGTAYTFNGRGEYTLVESRNTGFVLQGRTEPISETSSATLFAAFAMGVVEDNLRAEV